MPIIGSCHCGTVSYEYRDTPDWLTECNCSLCRRLGTLWAYSKIGNITITCEPGATIRYIRGDKTIAFHSCRTCGCTTHWENLHPEESDRMAVNMRLADPATIADIPIRHLDGAATWEFLD